MRIELGTYRKQNAYYDTDHGVNGHIAIVGNSGTGKTVRMERICIDLAKAGKTVLAIDMHHIFDDSEIFPAIFKDFKKHSVDVNAYKDGISCPLFTPLRNMDGVMEEEIDLIEAVTDVFARASGLKCAQREELRMAVSKVYEEKTYESGGCRAIYEHLQASKTDVSQTVLSRLRSPLQHNVFRDGDMCLQKGKINILRISNFDQHTQNVIAEVLLSQIWRVASAGQYRDDEIYVCVDEFQNLSLSKEYALSKLLTEGRKFHVNLILATQFLDNSAVETQRILQAGLILYFRPPQNKIREVARIVDPLHINEWASKFMQLECGEFVAVGPVVIGTRVLTASIEIDGRMTDVTENR